MVLALTLLIHIAYAASGFAFGTRLLRWLAPQWVLPAGAAAASAYLLGHGALGLVWLLAGLAKGFYPVTIILVCAVAFLIGSRRAIALAVNCLKNLCCFLYSPEGRRRPEDILHIGLMVYCSLLFGLHALRAMAQPVPANGDAASCYLLLPKLMAATHRLDPLMYRMDISQLHLSGELHYAALMSLGCGAMAKAVAFGFFAAIATLLVQLGAEVGIGPRGRWVLLALFLSSSTCTYYVYDGKLDLFSTAFGLASGYGAFAVYRGEGREPLRLTAVFLAFALSAKASFLVCLVPTLGLLYWFRQQRRESQFSWAAARDLAVAAGLGLVVITPNILKNVVWFGEPLLPFCRFGAGATVLHQTAWYSPEQTRHILGWYPLILIWGQYPAQLGNVSPLVLAFAPLTLLLALFSRESVRVILVLTATSMIGLVLWMAICPSVVAPRYILPNLLLLLLLPARAVDWVLDHEKQPRLLTFGAYGGMLAMLYLTTWPPAMTAFPVAGLAKAAMAPGQTRLAAWYDEPAHMAFDYLNQNVPPNQRIYWAARPILYWMRADLIQGLPSTHDREELLNNGFVFPLEELHRQGYRYIAIDKEWPVSPSIARFVKPGFLLPRDGNGQPVHLAHCDRQVVDVTLDRSSWLRVERVFQGGGITILKLQDRR